MSSSERELVNPAHAYLTRHGRTVTIRGPAPGARWAWITSLGYYVLADGRATPTQREHSLDLVQRYTQQS